MLRISLNRAVALLQLTFLEIFKHEKLKLPKYLRSWSMPKTSGSHFETNNYQDMAPVTKSLITKLIL